MRWGKPKENTNTNKWTCLINNKNTLKGVRKKGTKPKLLWKTFSWLNAIKLKTKRTVYKCYNLVINVFLTKVRLAILKALDMYTRIQINIDNEGWGFHCSRKNLWISKVGRLKWALWCWTGIRDISMKSWYIIYMQIVVFNLYADRNIGWYVYMYGVIIHACIS